MTTRHLVAGLVFGMAAMSGFAGAADDNRTEKFATTLRGYEETPSTLSTTGNGRLALRIDAAAQTIHFTLTGDCCQRVR